MLCALLLSVAVALHAPEPLEFQPVVKRYVTTRPNKPDHVFIQFLTTDIWKFRNWINPCYGDVRKVCGTLDRDGSFSVTFTWRF